MDRVSRRAAFLDRDGTLNKRPPEHRYVTSPTEFAWLEGAAKGAARLAAAGYVLAVASNQRGLSLGLVDEGVLRGLEAVIQRDLAKHSCAIAAFSYCPHDERAEAAPRNDPSARSRARPRPAVLLGDRRLRVRRPGRQRRGLPYRTRRDSACELRPGSRCAVAGRGERARRSCKRSAQPAAASNSSTSAW